MNTTVDTQLQRAGELKQAFVDFVLDADGELATALESFSAAQLTRSQQTDLNRRELVVDRFLIEGIVGNTTPIDLFLESEPDLTPADRQLVISWRRSFIGLFAIVKRLPDGFELMNWTTAKHYQVKPSSLKAKQDMERLKEGEILLTQIAPVTDEYWMFSSPWTSLGKLGKPKLAVAIGNFKQNYKPYLYSDAPELLAEAWASVERYHRDFIQFFGSDEVTLSGYELGKKLAEFQEQLTQKRLEAAGIDSSKSLAEIAAESGMTEEEIEEAAEAMGADPKAVSQFFNQKGQTKMVTPTIELPASLKKAEQVTVLTHPRWGQVFLPTYTQFLAMLQAADWRSVPNAEALVRKYLEDPEVSAFVWQRLAQQHPEPLQTVLREALERPDLNVATDLDALLTEFNKPLEIELPEIASVPIHLHELFQDALMEVNKERPKKKKTKASGGFQR